MADGAPSPLAEHGSGIARMPEPYAVTEEILGRSPRSAQTKMSERGCFDRPGQVDPASCSQRAGSEMKANCSSNVGNLRVDPAF